MAELPKYFYFVPKADGLTITVEDRSDRDVVEVVRCKDCKYWTRTEGDERWSVGDCSFLEKRLVMCEGYCAWAERKDEEKEDEKSEMYCGYCGHTDEIILTSIPPKVKCLITAECHNLGAACNIEGGQKE